MFLVSEVDAAAIRTALHEGGEPSAAVELRRRFPGIDSNVEARRFALTIAGWTVPERPAARDATVRKTSSGSEQKEGGSALSFRF